MPHDFQYLERVLRQIRALSFLMNGEVSNEFLYGDFKKRLREKSHHDFVKYCFVRAQEKDKMYLVYASNANKGEIYPISGCSECQRTNGFRCNLCWWKYYPKCQNCDLQREVQASLCNNCSNENLDSEK